METKDVLSFVACVGGVGGFVFGLYSGKKAKDIDKKLDFSLKKVTELTEVEVSQAVVDTAVKDKVGRVVEEKVGASADRAVAEISADMHKKIKDKVDASFREYQTTVETGIKNRYEDLLKDIDITDLKREITDQARRDMMRRLNGTFETLISEHSANLGKLTQIYSSIEDAVKKKA